jgi:AcrR family transcriptional regulator
MLLTMSTSISYEQGGRSRQKARTRSLLVDAARQLLAEGVPVTVEAAAERADLSRATAYRYFVNQRALLLAARPEMAALSMLPLDPPADPVERVRLAAQEILRLTIEWEPELRAMLRLSLEPGGSAHDLPLRKGRRLVWFEDALAPARRALGAKRFRRLVAALAGVAGIEALVFHTDIGGLERAEAVALLVWTAESLTAAELGAPRRP